MFRKMRRFGQQLDEKRCIEILKNEPRGVLAVLGDEGYPYTIPLDFVYDEGKIYFHSAVEGHKIDAIQGYNKASFCVLDKGIRENGDWAYYFDSVVAFGRIKIVEDKNIAEEKLRLLGLKYFPTAEMVERDMEKNAKRALVLELSIEHMTGKHVHEN